MPLACRLLVALLLFFPGVLRAQDAPPPTPTPTATTSPTRVDSPNEWDKLKDSCFSFNFKSLPDCAEELFTGDPIHIAVGSIAPQNGFGAGIAYVGSKNFENWRTTWDADAVASNNGSWRAGAYLQIIHSGQKLITFHKGSENAKPNLAGLPEHSVINLYAQAISLNKVTYFGLGPATTEAGRSFFGMREVIVGLNAIKPFYQPLSLALYGELNGRLVSLRPSDNQPSPSIETLYTEATAPGLLSQPGTFQLGEGLRMTPVLGNDVWRLNNSVAFQQFVTPGSNFSFQRITTDLGLQYALYSKTTRVLRPRLGNGPDSCVLDPGDKNSTCPKPYVRNTEGSLGVRLFSALSMTPGSNLVPFYFDPTLGGSDINGQSFLASYQDYRFRAPDVLLVRESFEHSLFSLPIGFALMADEGKVALTRGGLGTSPWLHSFSTGLTLRAGGFPQVYLLFSWGGNEGTHTNATLNSSLLGGAFRPSLY
jgi:hypothetical protein